MSRLIAAEFYIGPAPERLYFAFSRACHHASRAPISPVIMAGNKPSLGTNEVGFFCFAFLYPSTFLVRVGLDEGRGFNLSVG